MALFQCKLFSAALFRSVNVNVILPAPDSGNQFFKSSVRYPQPGEKYQVLWLLHGISADESDWQRFSGIERYAQTKNVAVVMPDGYNSMYTDTPFGGNYYTYISQELPQMLRSLLPLSEKREDNFIAGLSMDGFGAFKIALLNPQNYAAAASLSGGLMPTSGEESPGGVQDSILAWKRGVYGANREHWNRDTEDLLYLLENQIKAGADLPKLYECCGTEDFLYQSNLYFRDHARELGADLTYEEGPGVHNFDFWDPFIRRVLDWLPLKESLTR